MLSSGPVELLGYFCRSHCLYFEIINHKNLLFFRSYHKTILKGGVNFWGYMGISLGSSLDITQVIDLQTQYLAQISQDAKWQVDGGDVCRVDAAGLQLLLALFSTLEPSERKSRWLNISPVLLEAATCAGMAEVLGLTPAE